MTLKPGDSPIKSAETRQRILKAALELFRERGFARTTMRQVAQAAGVATGAAYYYFPSKDAIVMAFYEQTQAGMLPMLEEALAKSRKLERRLRDMVEVKLRYFADERRLMSALAANTDPKHPLSPFSAETAPIRDRDIAFFARALEGADVSVSGDLGARLPAVLWLYQMGLILFWLYDESEGQARTRSLANTSAKLVAGLIKLAGMPLMRPLRKTVVDLIDLVMVR